MNEQLGLASVFLRNRHLLVLTILVILVGGYSASSSLPRLEDPRIVNRNITIITTVPGASSERVETLVTEPLEQALQEINSIKDIESTSTAGVSLISVELKPSVTAAINKDIFSEVRDKVSEVTPQFPPEASDPFIDDKRDPVAFTLITAVGWNSPEVINLTIMNRVAEELANRLRTVQGTELVRLYGNPKEEIVVSVNPESLTDLGMSVQDLSTSLSRADAKIPAGTFRGSRSNINLEVTGELNSVSRVAGVPVLTNGNSGMVRVGDIATVQRGWQQPLSEIALVDGNRVLFVATRMESDQRVDQWAPRVNEVIEAFDEELGSTITLDRIFEQERYTTDQLSNLVSNLIAGAAVVMAVIFIMMGWRLALVVGSALPLVIAMVMFGWQITGNAIHQMSVFGMIIALGLLIDNAIVVADEIAQHRQRGLSPTDAVEKAIRHLFLPLLASTLTTVLAFAPILLLPGSAGDFVGSIGSSVIMAVIASFFVAMTVIAGLAGIFSVAGNPDSARWWVSGIRPTRIINTYHAGLSLALKRPVLAIAIAVLWPVSGFMAAAQLGNEFFPPVDRDMFELQVSMPNDSSVENTMAQAQEVEKVIREFEATEHVFWMVGGSFPTVYYNLIMNKDNSSYYAHAIVTAESSAAAKAMIQPLQARLDENFPEAQIVLRQFGQGPPVTTDIEYRLYGPSMERLQDIGEQIRLVLQSHPDVLHTKVTLPRGEPKIWFNANEDEARLTGLNLNDISNQLQANLEGSLGGSVLENLERLPIRVRYDNGYRGSLDDIAGMQFVSGASDGWISMHSLGELELRPEIGGITRFNAQRTNRIQAYTKNDALPLDVTFEVLQQLEDSGFEMPVGYRLDLGGAAEQESEATGNLLIYAPLLLTFTIATLVLLFKSGVLALLLGAVATLSIGLGLFSTWVMGFPISFNTILGTLGLIGLAFNNSIVVIAAIRANPAAESGNTAAVVDAVMSTTRHIFSTTMTTIGGFLPLLIFVGGDFWPSLSIVLAGGVGGSMILALLLVPSAYVLLNRARPSQESDYSGAVLS